MNEKTYISFMNKLRCQAEHFARMDAGESHQLDKFEPLAFLTGMATAYDLNEHHAIAASMMTALKLRGWTQDDETMDIALALMPDEWIEERRIAFVAADPEG